MNPKMAARATEMREKPAVQPVAREGFAKLPNSALLHFSRLMSGNVQLLSVIYINAENQWDGKRRWTRPISHEELTKVTRCGIRAVESKLKDLVDRGVLEAKKTSAGYSYHIPFEKWPDLPDMPSDLPEVAVPSDLLPTDETIEDAKTKAEFKPAFKAPGRIRVEAGKKTKPIEISAGAADKIQFDSDTNFDFECDGVFRAGVLRLSLYAKQRTQGEREQTANPKNIATRHPQHIESIKPELFASLHSLLDDYCLRHHGTIPNNKLLAQIQKALGKATIRQLERVLKAKIRTGKPISMGLLINLAGDAALAADRAEPIEYDPMGRPRRKTTG